MSRTGNCGPSGTSGEVSGLNLNIAEINHVESENPLYFYPSYKTTLDSWSVFFQILFMCVFGNMHLNAEHQCGS